MGTAVRYHQSNTNIVEKAASYRIQAVQVDGNDVLAVESLAKEAMDYIRTGNGPFFMEAITYRFRPHSMFDAELYRTKAEVEEAKKRDPILLFTNYLKERKLLEEVDLQAIEDDVATVVQHSVDFAEAATWEPIEELTRFVYSEQGERRLS
jgi:pyruvate dehydrogenase E1 component alpha subunit/2-oxoisovalerate dehydrogenase E1 component